MMTLDEAIEHARQRAEDCTECGKEHKQLAEWLEELKHNREVYRDLTDANLINTETYKLRKRLTALNVNFKCHDGKHTFRTIWGTYDIMCNFIETGTNTQFYFGVSWDDVTCEEALESVFGMKNGWVDVERNN